MYPIFETRAWLAEIRFQAGSPVADIVKVFVEGLPVTEISPLPTMKMVLALLGPTGPPVFPSAKSIIPGVRGMFIGPSWLMG
jgi:hypothetical protein